MNDTPDLEDLGRRAVACAGWRWMRGMLCLTDDDGYASRIISVGLSGRTSETADAYVDGGIICRSYIKDDALPDLTDPATLGCLLALVREAWGSPGTCTGTWPEVSSSYWYVGGLPDPVRATRAETEAEALVAALEAAGGEG